MTETEVLYPIIPKEYKNEFFSSEKGQEMADISSAIFSFVKDSYLSFFPNEYFKTIRIKSSLEGITEFKSFMHSVPKIKEKPIIIFEHEDVDLVEDTIFTDVDLARNPITKDGNDGIPVYGVPFLDLGDYVDGNTFGLLYRMNRYRLQTNILMVTSGRATQLNLYNDVINNIRHKTSYTLEEKISCKLNNAHIINIAKILNVDYKSDSFINILNTRSLYPIRKVHRPNNIVDFYMEATLNLNVTIPAFPSIANPGKNGMIEESGRITDSIIVEADIPSSYQFVVSKEIIPEPIVGIVTPIGPSYIAKSYPIDIPKEVLGYTNIISLDIVIEKPEDNFITIRELFGESMTELVDYLYSKSEYISDYLLIHVYKNGLGVACVYNDMILRINEPDSMSLYNVLIYVNLNKINKEANDKYVKIIGTLRIEE